MNRAFKNVCFVEYYKRYRSEKLANVEREYYRKNKLTTLFLLLA